MFTMRMLEDVFSYSWRILPPILILLLLTAGVESTHANAHRKQVQHGDPETNYGVYQPIINIEVPDRDSKSCAHEKIDLDELKERFTIQEVKLDRILEMLQQRLCLCASTNEASLPDDLDNNDGTLPVTPGFKLQTTTSFDDDSDQSSSSVDLMESVIYYDNHLPSADSDQSSSSVMESVIYYEDHLPSAADNGTIFNFTNSNLSDTNNDVNGTRDQPSFSSVTTFLSSSTGSTAMSVFNESNLNGNISTDSVNVTGNVNSVNTSGRDVNLEEYSFDKSFESLSDYESLSSDISYSDPNIPFNDTHISFNDSTPPHNVTSISYNDTGILHNYSSIYNETSTQQILLTENGMNGMVNESETVSDDDDDEYSMESSSSFSSYDDASSSESMIKNNTTSSSLVTEDELIDPLVSIPSREDAESLLQFKERVTDSSLKGKVSLQMNTINNTLSSNAVLPVLPTPIAETLANTMLNYTTNTTNSEFNTPESATSTSESVSNTTESVSNTSKSRSNTSELLSNTSVSGFNTSVPGSNTTVSVFSDNVPGSNTTDYGSNTTVPGSNTTVSGFNDTLYGSNTTEYGSNTNVPGSNITVPGFNDTVYGSNTTEYGSNTNVPGSNITVSGFNDTLYGSNTTDYGSNTTVPGSNTTVSGFNDTLYGSNTTVPGSNTTVSSFNDTLYGSNTTDYGSNTTVPGSNITGSGSITESGFNTTVLGSNTTEFGSNTNVSISSTPDPDATEYGPSTMESNITESVSNSTESGSNAIESGFNTTETVSNTTESSFLSQSGNTIPSNEENHNTVPPTIKYNGSETNDSNRKSDSDPGNTSDSPNGLIEGAQRSNSSENNADSDTDSNDSFGYEDYSYYSDDAYESDSQTTSFSPPTTATQPDVSPTDSITSEIKNTQNITNSATEDPEWVNNEPDSSPSYSDYYNDEYGDYEGSDCRPFSKVRDPPKDCDDVAMTMTSEPISGEYCVYPSVGQGSIRVFCDLQHDDGGWTVIQRHETNFDFGRTWQEYSEGFGDLSADFWLGNGNIHRLSTQDVYQLRIDIADYNGNAAYALYDDFHIGDEGLKYQLVVGRYSGDAGDSLRWHNHHAFSTRDEDHDVYEAGNCAQIYQSGWWYTSCLSSNLNGMRLPSSTRTMGIVWTRFEKGANLASATMKIRRANLQRSSHSDVQRSSHVAVKRVETERVGVRVDGAGGEEQDGEEDQDQDLKAKTKKNKFNKIFKNFYNKWKR